MPLNSAEEFISFLFISYFFAVHGAITTFIISCGFIFFCFAKYVFIVVPCILIGLFVVDKFGINSG